MDRILFLYFVFIPFMQVLPSSCTETSENPRDGSEVPTKAERFRVLYQSIHILKPRALLDVMDFYVVDREDDIVYISVRSMHPLPVSTTHKTKGWAKR